MYNFGDLGWNLINYSAGGQVIEDPHTLYHKSLRRHGRRHGPPPTPEQRQQRRFEKQQRRAQRLAALTPAERQAEEQRRQQRRFAKQQRRSARGGYYPPGVPTPVTPGMPSLPTTATPITATLTPVTATPVTATPVAPVPAAPAVPQPGQPGWKATCKQGSTRWSGQALPPGFTEAKYLARNSDIAPIAARTPHGAAMHYSCHGWKEKRGFAGLQRPGYLAGIFSNWDRS